MKGDQFALFDAGPALPDGFVYEPEVLSHEMEASLVRQIPTLDLKEYEFQGFTGKRRVAAFGARYDRDDPSFLRTTEIPEFILPVRELAARVARMPAELLQMVLVTEYGEGVAIGWHRDRAVYDEVVGVSLLSSCNFRLRRKVGTTWECMSLTAEPRSVYVMAGESRSVWEHSIPAVKSLRYSITFRNLRGSAQAYTETLHH